MISRSCALVVAQMLVLVSCGGDTSTPVPDGDGATEDATANNTPARSIVEAINPKASVIDTHRSCSVGNLSRDDCYSYGVTFVLANNSTKHAIDRLSSVKIEVGNRDLVVDVPYACKEHPWNVPPNAQTSVIEVRYVANSGGFWEDIELWLPCGSIDDFVKMRVAPEPFSAGTPTGTLTLTLEGLMEDASTWTVEEELTF